MKDLTPIGPVFRPVFRQGTSSGEKMDVTFLNAREQHFIKHAACTGHVRQYEIESFSHGRLLCVELTTDLASGSLDLLDLN